MLKAWHYTNVPARHSHDLKMSVWGDFEFEVNPNKTDNVCSRAYENIQYFKMWNINRRVEYCAEAEADHYAYTDERRDSVMDHKSVYGRRYA